MARNKKRPPHDWSPAAQLIFGEIGAGKMLRTQADLRRTAAVGSQQLHVLRTTPEDLTTETCVKLCDAVGIDLEEFFSAISRPNPTAYELERIRRRVRRHASRFANTQDRISLEPSEFFEQLVDRNAERGLLLAAFFPNKPLASESESVTSALVRLLMHKACIALHVPVSLTREGDFDNTADGGIVGRHYYEVFLETRAFIESLYYRSKSDQSSDANIADRLGLFVLSEDVPSQASRIVIPPETRTALVVFHPAATKLSMNRWLVAEWSDNHLLDDARGIEVAYDPAPPRNAPKDDEKLQLVREFFSHLEPVWETFPFNLQHASDSKIWTRINLPL